MPEDPPITWFMAEVRVADWPVAARWYLDVLGLKPVLEDIEGRFLLLDAGGGRIALKEGTGIGDRGAVRLVFQVRDVDASRARLVGRGLVVSEATESAEGYREIRLTDPEGTPIHLFSWVKPRD